MKVVVLYRPASEHARRVEQYMADFERFHPGEQLESRNIDSIDGQRQVTNYGITQFPAIIAIKDDGQMQQMWQGIESLPLMNDLAYYLSQ